MSFLSGLTTVVLAPGVPHVHKTLTPYLIERQSSCLLFQKKKIKDTLNTVQLKLVFFFTQISGQ